jgi:hypothetical protein
VGARAEQAPRRCAHGLGLAEWRLDEYDAARALFDQVLRLDPQRDDVRQHLASVPEGMGRAPERPPLVLPDTMVHYARAHGDVLEVRTDAGWEPFYIRGVNLGAALPGKFPSQFPDADTYRTWVAEIGAMGANAIRVYTLHPPAFYDAVAAHNAAHPDRPLWLLHGVWAELPPEDDYHDAQWKGEFFAEMERVIDVLHGRADVKPRPGHAYGYYTADVSRWTLGLILGREWEPYSVAEFNGKHAGTRSWHGRYVRIDDAPAMDAWLAEAMDHAVMYETHRYRAQRPVAYTNWPTLDPMRHPVEMNSQDELEIRGVAVDRTRRAHNEDEVALGEVPVSATTAYPAGWFAAYHVYPYYPDFMVNDPVYGAAQSPYGASSYFGYLADLKQRYEGVPLVIAEYGVPTSWGIAHFNPQGWHHGGHTEAASAEINARLTREIAAAGMAGGVLFAWIDEWFKHTWVEEPMEKPAERNRMWWNRMNPEQHYGVLALEPVRRLGETPAQRATGWLNVTPAYAGTDGTRIRTHADEAFLWLHVSGPAAAADRLVVGFDVSDPAAGALRLPGGIDAPASPAGLEYVLQIDSTGARIVAAPGAFPFEVQTLPRGAARGDVVASIDDRPAGFFTGSYTHGMRQPARRITDATGRYETLRTVVNRARVAMDSTHYAGMGYDRGVLREGPLPDGAWERAPGNAIEVRIPWTLIGVTDPSSRHVYDPATASSVKVDAIRIVAAAQTRGGWSVWPESGHRRDVASVTWQEWEQPEFRSRRRPVFHAMRETFREMTTAPRMVTP